MNIKSVCPRDSVTLLVLLLSLLLRCDCFAGESGAKHALQIGGVQSRPVVASLAIKPPSPLHVQLRLKNISNSTVIFGYASPFIQHIRIFDAKGEEVTTKNGAPLPEPVEVKITLKAHEARTVNVLVKVWHYFELPAGRYTIHFYYDLRFVSDQHTAARLAKNVSESNFVRWGSRVHSFNVLP